jgi:hypothetical protein
VRFDQLASGIYERVAAGLALSGEDTEAALASHADRSISAARTLMILMSRYNFITGEPLGLPGLPQDDEP